MRKFLIFFGFLLTFTPALFAAEYHFGADVLSGHVWRGQAIGSDSALGIQPSFRLTTGGLSLSATTHSFIQDRDTLGGFTEARVTAAHAFNVDRATLSVGVHQEFYAHTDGEDTATEVFSSLHLPAPLSPKITVGYNFSNLSRWGYDWYVALSGSTRIRCVDVSASLGLSDADGWLDFHNVSLTASRRFDLPHLTVSPHVRLAVASRDTQYWILGTNFSLR